MDFTQKDADLGGTAALPPVTEQAPPPAPPPVIEDDLPPPETGLTPPPDMDADTFDVMGAAWTDETIRTDAWDYASKKRRELADQMFDLLPSEAQARIWNKARNATDVTGWDTFERLVVAEAAAIAPLTPETSRIWSGYPLTPEAFKARIDDGRKAELDAAQRVLDQPGGAIAEFMGASARAMTDQVSLMMLPLGGGSGSIMRTIATEAALGAVGEAAILPREYAVAEELDLQTPDPVSRVAMGAALGGGLAAGMIGVVKGSELAVRKGASWLEARRTGVTSAMRDGDDALSAEIAIDDAEASLLGGETVQQRLAPRMDDAGTLSAIVGDGASAGLPPVTPDAPEGWAAIRNGIFAGESGGDYNALFGYQNRKGGRFSRVKLTEMSVDQAIEFSDPRGAYGQWVKGQIGRVATPMGAYQIVGTTLRAAKKALGLQGDEIMTPELQERLGHWIYREQGTGAWEGYRGPRSSFTPSAADDMPTYSGPTSRGYTSSGQVTAGDGFRVDVEYEVVDASSLVRASGDFQPRDRSRVASDAWIADTAARLDPAQLMPSPTADRGAPIVGPDNMIESGNGRFGAISRAYERHPDRAAQYRAQIEAAGFAIPEGVSQPVLIARRTSDLSREDRVRFTIDAQDSGVAVMTPTEVARASSRAMTPQVLGRLDPAQPVTAEANAEFVRSALAALPRSARNAMFDAGGLLNSAGARQLREAIFARAWPDPDILARYTEGDAAELKSLLEALDRAAPAWAALRADIEAGRVTPEMDISGHVLDAMRLIGAARDIASRDGLPIAKAIAQLLDDVDMLEGAVAPLTAALVRKFWTNGRAASADKVADFLTRYADDARKAGAEGGMFEAPGPRDVLTAIDRETFGDLPEDLGAARGYAQPPARAPEPLPDAGFDQGATSAEAQAADDAIRAEVEAELAPAKQPPENAPGGMAEADAEAEAASQFEAARAQYGDLSLTLPDGNDYSARELLDELDTDIADAAVLDACGIIPKGTAE